MNHRLNAFGHLALDVVAGAQYAHASNAGMLDIVLALEWVRDNIAAFDGDPQNVTIFGESGGGGKVLAMLSMPAARNLFHRAVVQSGPFVHATTRERAEEIAHTFLAELGISKATLEKIHTVPMQRLVEASLSTEAKMQGARVLDGTMGCWQPVLDGDVLPYHPGDPRSHALSQDVPLMIGTTKDELAMHFGVLPTFATMTLQDAAAICRMVTGESMDDALVFYNRLRPLEKPGYLMTDLLSDLAAWMPTIRLTEGRAKYAKAPVFHYVLGWRTPVMDGRFRSPHALDIPLMFDNVNLMRKFVGPGSEPQIVAAAMSESWIAFARSGCPDNKLIPPWPRYSAKQRHSMVFNVRSEIVEDYNASIRKFWDQRVCNSTSSSVA